MVKDAVASGKGEDVMWKSVEYFSDYLEHLKKTDDKEYWKIMRGMYESIYGDHYTEMFAKMDVEAMHSTDLDGVEHKGEYWSCEKTTEAMKNRKFPEGTTEWDFYVACNAFWHDLRNVLRDEDIIECADVFFFHDEDWCGDGKIWKYMSMKY